MLADPMLMNRDTLHLIALVLSAGKPLTIGRSPLGSYTIPLPSVSKLHCRLYSFVVDTGDTVVVLEDLSSNGLVCNNRRVLRSSVILRDCDVFEIGDQCFHFTRTAQPHNRPDGTDGGRDERTLANYSISNSRLGSGGFSVVRLGFDFVNGRQTACKAIKLDAQDQSRGFRQIKTEIEMLKRVGEHPGINQIYDAFVIGKEAFIFLQLMAGGDLFEYLARRGPLQASEAKWFVFQIGLALAHLHLKCNIAHRDLKLENVLLDGYGVYPRAQVADFGQAMITNRRSSSLRGTMLYMAPEALSGRTRQLGFDLKPVDCWSLGIMASMLLVGSHPFNRWPSKHPTQVFSKSVYGESARPDLMDRFKETRVAEAVLEGQNAMLSYEIFAGPREEDARELILNLLAAEPTVRWTIEAALESRWIAASRRQLTELYAAKTR
ncbi:BZ3500_MvSof-1268-A1-R1_Chr7-3g09578 [Microbotryum saponariae]|uniref:BZ3500_MvSof-1268-A1-R1_Chr7-3g09578 protein n=1 Tax=Microbotryum saponariae TaxID=289078 RepID=A0A2X0KX78_9BASI|nr:BZ3501_MvSof-1269-A2-R1_Chr7-2g09301 [Microbotryum saponariae]SDA02234.1 BZ3500_MvSof-1268-A1-R1_Chr7-3g09578 [Microbotryum saponariae]